MEVKVKSKFFIKIDFIICPCRQMSFAGIPSLLDVSVKRQVHKLLATFQVESMPFRDSGQDLRSGASGGWGAFI